MKVWTVVNETQLGWFEDSSGVVGASRLRADYANATKALWLAERNANKNENAERQPPLEAEVVKAQEALSSAEKAVSEYKG